MGPFHRALQRLDYFKISLCVFLGVFVVLVSDAKTQDAKSQDSSITGRGFSQKADLLITNGRIVQWNGSFDQALAIQKNRIVWTGSSDQASEWKGANTQVIDAMGATVTPGFNDAHVHFVSGSLAMRQVQLLSANNLDDVKQSIRTYLQDNPNIATVVGRGWVYGAFPDGLPTRQILDELVDDRPALMRCYDGHTVWVNSFVLQVAGIDRETPDPPGGIIVKHPKTGEPTGVLKESAQRLIDHFYPKPTLDDKRNAVLLGIKQAHQLGITSIQEAGTDSDDLAVFESLRRDGLLQLRTTLALSGKPGMSDSDFQQMSSERNLFRALGVQAVKLFVDGVIESHTAVMLSPYANQGTSGLPIFEAAELHRTIAKLDEENWQVMVHAIGDGGVRMVLDAFEHAIKTNVARTVPRRHRLEHIETLAESDIARFGQLEIVASMQPMHADPNSNIFQVWAVNIGNERSRRAWAWQSIQQHGGKLAFGTDWPVVGIDPRPGLHVAMTRQTLDGMPPEGFVPSQRLSLSKALEAYTRGSAYAELQEQSKGSLEVGMLADLIVWDRDLFSVPTNEVHRANIRFTIFDGKVVYQ